MSTLQMRELSFRVVKIIGTARKEFQVALVFLQNLRSLPYTKLNKWVACSAWWSLINKASTSMIIGRKSL